MHTEIMCLFNDVVSRDCGLFNSANCITWKFGVSSKKERIAVKKEKILSLRVDLNENGQNVPGLSVYEVHLFLMNRISMFSD